MSRFLSPRQTAKLPDCPITECFLRRMIKEGDCPGFYSGSHFLVNAEALFEMLEQRSRKPMSGGQP